MINLKKKLQTLKVAIKQWLKANNQCAPASNSFILNQLSDLNKKLDQGGCNEETLIERNKLLKKLYDLNNLTSLDMAQKEKVHWSIEGDEKSKYFLGIINKNRSQLAIRGILEEGEWIIDPSKVKNEFLNHFTNRFSVLKLPRFILDIQFDNRLSSDQKDDLERNVTQDEIKRAVWDCGTKKSSGPDGFTFEFIRSFFSNRQILNGPFILNELLSWCKQKKFKAMIFKVDFEKAFNSIRWDYLDDVLSKFGFGDKWRGWIKGCLNSAMGSILVNGSPTSEFKFYKGLKQGDPLSPFLFYFDNGKLTHLFQKGVERMSLQSKLMGIGIQQADVDAAATFVGCSTFSAPFLYLGVKVGGSMSRISSWDDTIAKLHSRLSKWKLKTLSIRGRLTLIKSVLSSLSLYHMSIYKVPMDVLNIMESTRRNFLNGIDKSERKSTWIGWKKVLASKKYGGLGVSSFFALNRALLF
ncbi:RNA-directed DNA polymerase, eukaryota [Tanacetum coccineum]